MIDATMRVGVTIHTPDAIANGRMTLTEKTFRKGQPKACLVAYTFYETDYRVMRYAEALIERGYEVDVLALRQTDSTRFEKVHGVNLYRIQRRASNEKHRLDYFFRLSMFLAWSSLYLTVLHARRRYRIVHVHSVPDVEVFAAWFPKLTGAKIILDIHDIVPELYCSKFNATQSSWLFKTLVFLERWSGRFADHVIVANHLWEPRIVERSVAAEKCSVIINYPDSKKFRRGGENCDNAKFTMIYAGSLNWHQGLDLAVRALGLVEDEVSGAEFHIYGSGPQLVALTELVKELGLEKSVLFKPPVPVHQLGKILAAADLGVVPKRADCFGDEAFSTKIMEMMATGVPVVVARTTVDQHYFNDDLVAFFIPGDVEDLARCMKEMRGDEERRRLLIANGLAHVEAHNWDGRKEEYYRIIDLLLEESNRGIKTKKAAPQ